MRSVVMFCLSAISLGWHSSALASSGDRDVECIARVVHAEELPYAAPGAWFARVTLEVTPRGGLPYLTIVSHNVLWQTSSPRRGQTFRLRCNVANELLY
jgi:hypothetical protein